MWLQFLQLINPFGIVEGVLENRRYKRETEAAIQKQRLENVRQGKITEAEWNLTALKTSGWKGSWLTLLVSIPMVLAFFPDAVPGLKEGFIVLEQMPQWYQGAIGLVFSAAFGAQSFQQFSQTRFKNKLNKAYTLPGSTPTKSIEYVYLDEKDATVEPASEKNDH